MGLAGVSGDILGNRMAPNGRPLDPRFSLDLDINVELLPKKPLYLFADNKFWAQTHTHCSSVNGKPIRHHAHVVSMEGLVIFHRRAVSE